jgi:hypothetical protein
VQVRLLTTGPGSLPRTIAARADDDRDALKGISAPSQQASASLGAIEPPQPPMCPSEIYLTRRAMRTESPRSHRCMMQIEANQNGYHIEKHGDDNYGIIVRDKDSNDSFSLDDVEKILGKIQSENWPRA